MLVAPKQYSSVRLYFTGSAPGIDNVVSDEDTDRLNAYDAFKDFYYNRPETLRVQLTEQSDQKPWYLPSSRKIVEATNRFLAVDFGFLVNPKWGNPTDQGLMYQNMAALFRREKIYTKFNIQRRFGLIQGDQVWHIVADPTKPQGKRLSMYDVDPSSYFPIEDPNNPTRIIGVHLVDKVHDPRDKTNDPNKLVARRQTYRKMVDSKGVPTGGITSEISLWEIGTWDDRNMKQADMKLVQMLKPAFELPPEITSIPVYHIRNNPMPSVVFGNSLLAGVETILNGLNQSMTDEDYTMVMQGLGMYWTNAGPPKNPDGSPAPWNLGPGQVVEVGADQTFGRVTGVSSVAPMQEHMNFGDAYMRQGLGVPDIAAGKVDVSVASSGIALKLELLPILSANAEREQEILVNWDQMLYDISHMWFPAYEALVLPDIEVSSVVGDPVPQDRDAKIQEILLLQAGGLITIAMAQAELAKLGYDFSEGDAQKVIEEAQQLAIAKNGDPYANRFAVDADDDQLPSTAPDAGQAASIAAQQGAGPVAPLQVGGSIQTAGL